MDDIELGYLALVLVGFSTFAVALFVQSLRGNGPKGR